MHSSMRSQLEGLLNLRCPPWCAIEPVAVDVLTHGIGDEVADRASRAHSRADVGCRDVEGGDVQEGHPMPRHVSESRTAAIITKGLLRRNGKIVERERTRLGRPA